MIANITKYAVMIDDPLSIRYHLERAWHLAKSGRPGPCWLDIPVDVQSAQVDKATLRAYDPAEDAPLWSEPEVRKQCSQVLERIRAAKRPAILAWTHDLIASNDQLFCGRPGTIGDRAGNFTVQNADLVLVLGSRLNVRQVTY